MNSDLDFGAWVWLWVTRFQARPFASSLLSRPSSFCSARTAFGHTVFVMYEKQDNSFGANNHGLQVGYSDGGIHLNLPPGNGAHETKIVGTC